MKLLQLLEFLTTHGSKPSMLSESANLSTEQKFIIMSWGKLLYLDYLNLPNSKSMANSPELSKLAKDYIVAVQDDDEDQIEELDEWIGAGAPLKNGSVLISKKTVDDILTSCQHKAGKRMTLFRYDSNVNRLKPNSWLSMSKGDGREQTYGSYKTVFNVQPDDLIIDALNLADKDEVIVSTNELIKIASRDLG